MKISLIAAMTPGNHVIGKDGGIPWKLSSDMKRFKELTTGQTIVMGRNTYESIGRPLPNRVNIVITRNRDYSAEGCIIAHDIEESIKLAREIDTTNLMVIGGNEIYRNFMTIADELLLTFVLGAFDGDTFFPQIDSNLFKMVECSDPIRDEKDECFHVFCEYVRK